MVGDITQRKLEVLAGLYEKALKDYSQNAEATMKLAADKTSSPQFDAMNIVANAMLNRDEVLTKE